MMQTATNRLELISVTKIYPGCVANDAINLRVAPGEIHALIGENGAGKSTLMKIIYGVVEPDEGQILWNDREVEIEGPAHARKLGMGMVFQHFSLFDTLTVTQNIALYLTQKEYGSLSRLRTRILQVGQEYGLDVNPDRLVDTLSVGEQQRVEIIRCLLQDIQLLILDEPTAVLTPPEVEQLMRILRQVAENGCSILFISHKLDEVNALCDQATILRGGQVTGSCVPSDTSASQMSRLMLGDDLEIEDSLGHGSPGESLLTIRDVSLPPQSKFGTHLHHINLAIHSGEVIGLAGVAGNGQDELVDLINGQLSPSEGDIALRQIDIIRHGVMRRRKMGLATVHADRLGRGSVAGMSLTENYLLTAYTSVSTRHGLLDWQKLRDQTLAVIEGYNVKTSGPENSADSLSGGNLQKFIIGREITQSPTVLICFYPTWGVDVGAANQIHQELAALRDTGAGILVISEDLDELYLLSDRIGAICRGKISPIKPKSEVSVNQLGQWMAGDFEGNATRETDHAH